MLNAFEKELEFKKAETERILPSLVSLFAGAGERPKVRFFEGADGTKAMRKDFLACKSKKIESLVNLDRLFELFPNYDKEYSEERIVKGIESSVIYTRKEGPLEGASDPSKLRTAKYISYEKFPLSADVTIFDNKVALATYRTKPIGIIIEDQDKEGQDC